MGEIVHFTAQKPGNYACQECGCIVFHWMTDETLTCVMCGLVYPIKEIYQDEVER